MNFGQAIEALKQNKMVRREGWNGKNMHIYLEQDYIWTLPKHRAAGVFAGQSRKYKACIVLFNAQGEHQPGWNASTPDVLAEDWEIVTE